MTADRIPLNDLTNEAYDALHVRLWNAETARDAWAAKAQQEQQRAEQAEAARDAWANEAATQTLRAGRDRAAIERVRALAGELAARGNKRTGNEQVLGRRLLIVLDEHREQ